MTGVRVDIRNGSGRAVFISGLELQEPLKAVCAHQSSMWIASEPTDSVTLTIDPVAATANELSGQLLSRFSAQMTYDHGGHKWFQTSSGHLVQRSTIRLFDLTARQHRVCRLVARERLVSIRVR